MVRLFRKKDIKNIVFFSWLIPVSLYFLPIITFYSVRGAQLKEHEALPTVSNGEQRTWSYTDEEFFLRGNKHYTEKDYENALQSYMMITKKGSAVLYNIANCLFHKEDYAQALVYLLRAEKGATRSEYDFIAHNKNLIFKKLSKQKENSWWQKITQLLRLKLPYISLLFLQLFFLMLWWILIIRMRKKQKGIKKIVRGLLWFSISIVAVILSERYMQQQICAAIIVKKEGKLFAGPDINFQVLSPLVYADGAKIKEVREGWYKIQYADMIGWVKEDVIQII